MGLFGFLKKDDKKKDDDLDLPPPPPSLDHIDQHTDLPEFPNLDDHELESHDDGPQQFDFSKNEEIEDLKVPEFDVPQMEHDIEPIEAPDDMDEVEKEMEEEHEEPIIPAPSTPMVKPIVKPIINIPQTTYVPPPGQVISKAEALGKQVKSMHSYMKVEDFRLVLGMLTTARSDIRKSEDGLNKYENIKAVRDKSFDKIRASLEDVQKKLMFVDKTLFEGE